MAAGVLAAELGVSLRTVYRDIATLIAAGAPVAGEAGVGYVLRPGFFLPPLMFSADEADALILGLRLAASRGDAVLARAAADALGKIAAVLPADDAAAAEGSGLLAYSGRVTTPHLPVLRQAIRAERRLRLGYTDAKGAASARVVWPFAIGFFADAEVLAAWCETRQDFRHFRLDRIAAAEALPDRYPRRRRLLFAEWRLLQDADGI